MNIYNKIKASVHREIILCAVISISVVITYSGIIKNEFIRYDDDQYVTDNIHIQQGISKEGVLWAFSTFYASNWHPVTWLSHMLDVELYGMNAGGHHFSNLLLHLANSLLLFFVLKNMTGAPLRSCAVALLFAIHPLHVESVAWVSERKDILSTFFWLLTTLSYIHYTRTDKRDDYLMALLFFLLALLAKPMAVTLPFTLLLLDYWPLRRVDNLLKKKIRCDIITHCLPLLREKVPFFLLSVSLSIITLFAQTIAISENIPFQMRMTNALVSYVIYLQKTIIPYNLGVLYPYPSTISAWQAAGAAFALGSITLLAVRHWERFPWLLVGWLWYLGTLVPVIGIVQVGIQAFADRYTYIPLIGIFMITSWGIEELFRNWRHKKIVLAAAAAVIVPTLTIIARIQTFYWQDSITLFEHTLQVTENNYFIRTKLGCEFDMQKQYEKALAQYKEALHVNPDFEWAIANYGSALFYAGKREESFTYYENSLKEKPNSEYINLSFGTLLLKKGDYDRAYSFFKEALRINPNSAAAYNKLGIFMLRKGHAKQAIMLFKKALEIDSEFLDAKMNLEKLYDYIQYSRT